MANLFNTAAARHLEILQSHAATLVTYRRGSDELPITVTRGAGKKLLDQSTGEMSWTDQDWIVESSLLGSLGEPERGDEIEVDGDTFNVLPPAEGVPCWQWYGNQKNAYRIHSERTKSA